MMKISILQFDVSWMDIDVNIQTITDHLALVGDGIGMLILPEMYLTGFNMDAKSACIPEDHNAIQTLIGLCVKHDLAIIGSLAIEDGGSYFNRVLLLTAKGIAARYDKQYLFSMGGEHVAFTHAHKASLISYKGWKILPQVCYDLRFPEGVRVLDAPDLIIYMANWPEKRKHHWDILLQARAIENQCFVIGCNRIGEDENGWVYPGHSQLVRPDGVFATLGFSTDHLGIEISTSSVENYRVKYPFLQDKKILS